MVGVSTSVIARAEAPSVASAIPARTTGGQQAIQDYPNVELTGFMAACRVGQCTPDLLASATAGGLTHAGGD